MTKTIFLCLFAATLKFTENHVHFTYANYVTSGDIDTTVATQILFHFVYIYVPNFEKVGDILDSACLYVQYSLGFFHQPAQPHRELF